MYRFPFVGGSMAFCLIFFFQSKSPLQIRMLPLMFLGSFASFYNYQIGQYGVYKNIDSIMKLMTDKKDNTEVGRMAD